MIRALDPEAAYWAALASYASRSARVTTVNDMYRQLEALGDAPRRSASAPCSATTSPTDEHEPRQPRRQCRRLRAKHGAAGGRIQVRVGIEWLPLASRELLRGARELADELGTGIHIHLNESLSEVEIAKKMFGRRPTEVAYEEGILAPTASPPLRLALRHRDRADAGDRDADLPQPLLERQARQRVARLPEMLAAGLNIGLGHDAAECNNSRDMFEVMKWASLLHRAVRVDASLQQASDVVRMATRNGAAALGHETGELVAGRKADVILVETNSTMFTPLMPESVDHVYSHLVFAANGSCVDTTICDGKVLMRAGGSSPSMRTR